MGKELHIRIKPPSSSSRPSISDSILLTIPLGVTADLGVAMKRCREKRIRKMKRLYPQLFPAKSHDVEGEGKEGGEGGGGEESTKKKKDDNGLTPRRDQYGSVLDYLEAKYVRGVMIPDMEEKSKKRQREESGSESSSNAGSCYSDASGFLDDSCLRTDVAQQVVATTGATKLEQEGKEDEDGFFVNVGDLEMADGYNDSDDVNNIDFDALAKKKDKTHSKKKRKHTHHNKPKKSNKPGNEDNNSISSMSSSSKQPQSAPNNKNHPKLQSLKQKCEYLKQKQERLYKDVVRQIHNMTSEHLPRRPESKEMMKLSITIPQNKSAGDDITFANPRIPGQKLRVKVPENCASGGKFVVSVPAPDFSKPLTNQNNFTKEAKETLDEFSRAWDEWIDVEAKIREVMPELGTYKPNNERLKKFDKLIHEFPKNLAHPIDAAFLRKVVRRERQNSSKRKKSVVIGGTVTNKIEVTKGPPQTLELKVPGKGTVFGKVQFVAQHFNR